MAASQDWELRTDKKISKDELEVLNSFLKHYRGKKVIIADKHRVDSKIVPIEGTQVAFKAKDEFWKILDFKRRIVHEEKPYIVNLGLWRTNPQEDEPKCLTIHELSISSEGKEHVLTLSTNDIYQSRIFYNIIDIFDEKKIISPETAYSARMFTNQPLQEFIKNHDWGKIIEGVHQLPDLANALFIIGKAENDNYNFHADFATILYQLIEFRKKHESELTTRDLLELDKAILELQDSELLRVNFTDSTGIGKTYPSKTVLLDGYYNSSQMRISERFTEDNGELKDQRKTLYKAIYHYKSH